MEQCPGSGCRGYPIFEKRIAILAKTRSTPTKLTPAQEATGTLRYHAVNPDYSHRYFHFAGDVLLVKQLWVLCSPAVYFLARCEALLLELQRRPAIPCTILVSKMSLGRLNELILVCSIGSLTVLVWPSSSGCAGKYC